MTKILTVGEILVEIIAATKGDGFREVQPLTGPYPSGAPAIFVDQIGRLGFEAAIIGRVGEDDFGHLNIARLAADGVDVSGVDVAAGEATGCAFVRYRPDGARSFVYTLDGSATATLALTEAGEALMGSCGHIHIMGTALSVPGMAGIALQAVDRVKARGGTLSFDPNIRAEMLNKPSLQEKLMGLIDRTDIFLPSGNELFHFTEAADEEGAVHELLSRGIGEIVIKRGDKGATYFAPGAHLDVTAHTVEERDPTGAGDCFGGTFVALRLAGEPPETALRYANAAGARAVTEIGPMEGASTRAELERFLEDAEARR
ncbi:tagatose kinase [Nitratireductor thuwali]|uniref:2-dehydro-3-deoxygluconokinase n=1 Tax=Nitratireductor thuwali TaxID=2267699 RepID=A0ABY5MJP7_9HYPH|nr:2-dehydro-3-deoxygluconokinase [Nitratireductor thuwali]